MGTGLRSLPAIPSGGLPQLCQGKKKKGFLPRGDFVSAHCLFCHKADRIGWSGCWAKGSAWALGYLQWVCVCVCACVWPAACEVLSTDTVAEDRRVSSESLGWEGTPQDLLEGACGVDGSAFQSRLTWVPNLAPSPTTQ